MHPLRAAADSLLQVLRDARNAPPRDLSKALVAALDLFHEAASSSSIVLELGKSRELLGVWPRLGDTDRALVAAKLQRILATAWAQVGEGEADDARGATTAGPRRPSRQPFEGDPLGAPVESVRGVGPKGAAALRARGLETLGDLLRVLPRSYEDRRRGGRVADLTVGQPGFMVGTVKRVRTMWARRTRGLRVVVEDADGASLTLMWFAAYKLQFEVGEALRASGIVRTIRGDQGRGDQGRGDQGSGDEGIEGLGMVHADVERLDEMPDASDASAPREGSALALPANPIVPRYPELDGVPRKRFQRILRAALDVALAEELVDPLPAALRGEESLPPFADALRTVHAPAPDADVEALNAFRSPAHQRFIFEELFALQLALARAASGRRVEAGVALRGQGRLLEALRAALPFSFTPAQERATQEIITDLRGASPMSRLLQGDVGSGKTVVAMAAALTAIEDGCQAVILAPTEVLAEQHARVLGGLASRLGVPHTLITSALTGARRRAAREDVQSGLVKLVIGTQALLDEGVVFDALGLAVIDEQHRFGVLQRAALAAKGPAGITPHLLVMTATPIPRTLALTLYGDLSISVIDAKPPGRMPIETRLYRAGKRKAVHEALRRAVDAGAQAYAVTPLVEASDKVDLGAAIDLHQELRHGALAGVSVGLLHGRLDAAAKREALERFSRGEDRVLVCTTVVEVGVDVPAATVMVIEHAERFGLAQLHQLRGRVGRGAGQSHCFLLLGRDARADAEERLRILTETDDGFRIAEADLRLRGPGEILGTVQAGAPALVVADLLRDADVLARARARAFALVAADPALVEPENARAWSMLCARYGPLLELVRIG